MNREMVAPVRILLAGIALIATAASAYAQDSITLNYEPSTESFHKIAHNYSSFREHITKQQTVQFAPEQIVKSHKYVMLSPQDDGLRVSTTLLDSDITLTANFPDSAKMMAMVHQQKAILAFTAATPDYILDENGAIVRYEITDEYRSSLKNIFENQMDLLSNIEHLGPQGNLFEEAMRKQYADFHQLPDSKLEPTQTPRLFSLSSLNGVVVKTDGTITEGVQIDALGPVGELSFVGFEKCTDSGKDNDCALLKHISIQSDELEQTTSSLKYVTYVLVQPNSLKTFRFEQGMTATVEVNGKQKRIVQAGDSIAFTYTGLEGSVNTQDYAHSIANILALPSGRKAELIDYSEAYAKEVKNMTNALGNCKPSGIKKPKPRNKRFSASDDEMLEGQSTECDRLAQFYSNKAKMRSISLVEDMPQGAKNTKQVSRFLQTVNTLFEQRAIYLSTKKMQNRKEAGETMDMDTQLQFFATALKEELLSTPVVSKRHKAYVTAVLANIDEYQSGANKLDLPKR